MSVDISVASGSSDAVGTVPCAICRRQFSRYTCPKCNMPYCSLICFRSNAHAECSEAFYRKEVELDVRNAPSASTEEKRRMMDLLKKFEEDSMEDSPLLEEEQEEDDDDLANRLNGVDLDSATYEELMSALTPAERDKFMRALGDPSSELAQQLLASEDLKKERIDPWWEAPIVPPADEDDRLETKLFSQKHFGKPPPVIDIPLSMLSAPSSPMKGPPLFYNICAICIAYAYVTRTLTASPLSSLSASDPDHAEARRMIPRLVPFLADKRSKIVHLSLTSVTTDLWSRFEPNSMTPRLFSLLLRDAATLLRPSPVSVLTTSQSSDMHTDLLAHPSVNAIRVLSDLHALFSTGSTPETNKQTHIAHKLVFYAFYIFHSTPAILRGLAEEVYIRAVAMEQEGLTAESQDAVAKSSTDGSLASRKPPAPPEPPRKPLVQEID